MNFTNISLFVFHWVLKSALEIEEVQDFFSSQTLMEKTTSRGVADSGRHSRFIGDWGREILILNMNKLSHTHLCTSLTNGGEYGWPSGRQKWRKCANSMYCDLSLHRNYSSQSLTWFLGQKQQCFQVLTFLDLRIAFDPAGYSLVSLLLLLVPCHWLLLSIYRWPLHISEFCIQSNL